MLNESHPLVKEFRAKQNQALAESLVNVAALVLLAIGSVRNFGWVDGGALVSAVWLLYRGK